LDYSLLYELSPAGQPKVLWSNAEIGGGDGSAQGLHRQRQESLLVKLHSSKLTGTFMSDSSNYDFKQPLTSQTNMTSFVLHQGNMDFSAPLDISEQAMNFQAAPSNT